MTLSALSAGPLHFLLLHAYLLPLSLCTALLEIQIEGRHGWAAKIPTWRYQPAWYKALSNGKKITGYHLYLHATLLLLLHVPLLFTGWSWFMEWTMLSLYCSYVLLWDALWFVCNPAFGFAQFRKGNVWWYTNWLGRFPRDYYVNAAAGFACALFRGLAAGAAGDPRLLPLTVPLQHALGWAAGLGAGAVCVGFLALHPHETARAVKTLRHAKTGLPRLRTH